MIWVSLAGWHWVSNCYYIHSSRKVDSFNRDEFNMQIFEFTIVKFERCFVCGSSRDRCYYQKYDWKVKRLFLKEAWSIRPPGCGNGSFVAEHWAQSSRNHSAKLETATFNGLRDVEPRCIVSDSNYTGRRV